MTRRNHIWYFPPHSPIGQLLPQVHGLVHDARVDVVHARDVQPDVAAGDDLVMVLEDNLCLDPAGLGVHLHVAVDVVVANAQGELCLLLNVRYTGVRPEEEDQDEIFITIDSSSPGLGVHFPTELLVRGHSGQHGLVVAGDGEVVAVADDVGGRGVDPEVGLPHVAQGLGPVMRQATHPGPGVSPVIAQAVEGGQAPTQPLTLLNTPHTTLIRHSLIAFRALHIQIITFRKDKGFPRL